MHLEAIRAGTGRGVLPCYVGDGHPLLERLTPPIPEIAPNTGSSSTAICAAPPACAR